MGAVRGVLLDLEGVLYQADEPIAGAIEAIAQLRAADLELRFLTNTTTKPRGNIVQRMRTMGFDVDIDHFFSPALAAGKILKDDAVRRVFLAAPAGLKQDFADFELVDHNAQAVVMGDLYLDFDWAALNQAFDMLRAGARFIALHKNRYCRRGQKITLDLGPFVAALEYAAGIEAEVVGKPSPAFYATAIKSLGMQRDQVLMVGDDIEADVGGAQQSGILGVQVRTGKYDPTQMHNIEPDALIDSIVDLPRCIAQLSGVTRRTREYTDPSKHPSDQ